MQESTKSLAARPTESPMSTEVDTKAAAMKSLLIVASLGTVAGRIHTEDVKKKARLAEVTANVVARKKMNLVVGITAVVRTTVNVARNTANAAANSTSHVRNMVSVARSMVNAVKNMVNAVRSTTSVAKDTALTTSAKANLAANLAAMNNAGTAGRNEMSMCVLVATRRPTATPLRNLRLKAAVGTVAATNSAVEAKEVMAEVMVTTTTVVLPRLQMDTARRTAWKTSTLEVENGATTVVTVITIGKRTTDMGVDGKRMTVCVYH